MDLIQWATNPWGQSVPIHIAWFLIWVAAIAGLAFVMVHAVYMKFFAKPKVFANDAAPVLAERIPAHVPRHSLGARMFHWIMAASMFTLLFTAFLPKVGVRFDWITYHWIAGIVLTISVLFHIFHATFVMDFWSIWPDRIDIRDAGRRLRRFFGQDAPPPEKFAKYPLENKLYHFAIMLSGLAVILTGACMMFRVRTFLFPRNPYLFGDMAWGLMYVLHGLAGVGLIALIMVHVYFGIRPEKLAITNSMIRGWMSRDFYLEEHDPTRWPVPTQSETPKFKGPVQEPLRDAD
jgi:cytochrome b subunit of formate dehydrogenase